MMIRIATTISLLLAACVTEPADGGDTGPAPANRLEAALAMAPPTCASLRADFDWCVGWLVQSWCLDAERCRLAPLPAELVPTVRACTRDFTAECFGVFVFATVSNPPPSDCLGDDCAP